MIVADRMPCVVYHLAHRYSDDRWHLRVIGDGDDLATFEIKEEARQEGERRGRQHANRGEPAQLIIHREDGSVETEFTYGFDPRDTPG
ncbi:DUF2188 domain-containing protein [Tahibacter sp. UC22_41]|uniref:DUF2188 domain-containing protein n=1 Tax=Tahibacter sp. UC22_41 TaxID=3350178 RepID=UPI0036DEA845